MERSGISRVSWSSEALFGSLSSWSRRVSSDHRAVLSAGLPLVTPYSLLGKSILRLKNGVESLKMEATAFQV
jgi:hypothetical protein